MGELSGTVAVILAGGMGTRLRSVVGDCPKVLAEIHGQPFLAYLLDQLAGAGVCEAVLCTGYRAGQVEDTLGASYRGLPLIYSRESSPLGTGGALRSALPLVRSDPVLVTNGDSFCEADLPAMSAWHHAHGAEATLLLARVTDTQRYGLVRIDDDGRLLGFEEKGGNAGAGWINAGIYLIARGLIETIPASGAVSLEREVFPAWVGRGLYGFPFGGRFLDIGTPAAYAEAEDFFARSQGDCPLRRGQEAQS